MTRTLDPKRLGLALLVVLAFASIASSIHVGQTGGEEIQIQGGSGELSQNLSVSSGYQPVNLLPYILATIGVGVLVVGYTLVRARRNRLEPVEDYEEGDERDETTALGEAAGAAADRIESAESVENEVYRAWREMTAILSVSNPEATTPGEFADEAVEAGMDREDVTELTELFEEVRYGQRDPAEREDRAITVLRRIEERYGGEQ